MTLYAYDMDGFLGGLHGSENRTQFVLDDYIVLQDLCPSLRLSGLLGWDVDADSVMIIKHIVLFF